MLLAGASLLSVLAVAGIGVVRSRSKLKQQMKELELRNKIAADLHDEVGSSLSSIHMLSQMASQQGGDATHKDILSRMSNNTRETMEKMGDIVWMIKPGEMESGSLKHRMEQFAFEISSSKDISLQLTLDGMEKLRLTMEQRKNIWLIFKEAINNAVKYSGTETLEVTAVLQNKEMMVQVEDHGKGFDSSVVKKGNGLSNMQHRAKELRGKLLIQSNSGTGTIIRPHRKKKCYNY
jgi:signal transduction histidine kinase